MAEKKENRRGRLAKVVVLLVLVIVAFCVLSSLQEKHGINLGLPSLELPSISKLYNSIGKLFLDDNSADEGQLSVHFLDVGQAKSILIKAPGANVLIDAGENNQGEQVLRYLREQGVKKLDIAIGTHPHSDHIGGMDTVIDGIAMDVVVLPEVPEELVPTNRTYTDLLLAIQRKELQITVCEPGMEFDLGGGAVLTLLAPLEQYKDLNDMSVVARLTFGDTSFLFTGDASADSEASMLKSGEVLRADVLDVGHHGSNTASTEAFLKKVQPRIAVISCGTDNSYGHPHREVMERISKTDAQVLRTDLQGTIVIRSNGKSLGIEKEKE